MPLENSLILSITAYGKINYRALVEFERKSKKTKNALPPDTINYYGYINTYTVQFEFQTIILIFFFF